MDAVNYILSIPGRVLSNDFRLDPAAKVANASYVGNGKINIARDALGEDLSIAADMLMDLFAQFVEPGIPLVLRTQTDCSFLSRPIAIANSYVSTDQPGWLWPERIAARNSVGTCIVDRKLTSVIGRQHFFFECADTACAGALYFDALGSLGCAQYHYAEPPT